MLNNASSSVVEQISTKESLPPTRYGNSKQIIKSDHYTYKKEWNKSVIAKEKTNPKQKGRHLY